MRDKHWIILCIFGVCLLFGGCSCYTYGTKDYVTVKIKKMERIHGEKSGKYLIFTENEVFQNTDSILYGKFNSSDLYGSLEAGKTYKLKVYGWRIRFLSMYRNIITVDEVSK